MATNISDQEPVLVLNDKKYIISELEPQAQYCVGQMNFIQGNINKAQEELDRHVERLLPIDLEGTNTFEEIKDEECATGACPIK